MRAALIPALLVLLLAACQPGGFGQKATGGSGPAAEAISVSPLDGPAEADAALPAAGSGAKAALDTAAPRMTEAELTPDTAASGTPAVPQDAAVDAAPEGDVPVPEAAPEVPEKLKTPTQIACEKKGGSYARAGGSGSYACVRQTRDGGKRCRKESDCEGLCLARSGSCAPITPLFGCQDILQQDGLRVTQCVD
jgi:hypothetical protein